MLSTDIFTRATLTERFRVLLSIKRSVLFFCSSEGMRSTPVFDVQLAVTLVRAETVRESLTYMQN